VLLELLRRDVWKRKRKSNGLTVDKTGDQNGRRRKVVAISNEMRRGDC
jgi:hypothetical protein